MFNLLSMKTETLGRQNTIYPGIHSQASLQLHEELYSIQLEELSSWTRICDQADKAAAHLQDLLSTFAVLLFLPTGVYQINFIVSLSWQYIFQVDWFYKLWTSVYSNLHVTILHLVWVLLYYLSKSSYTMELKKI